MSRYTDMVAAAVYAPTLTGGAKQRTWLAALARSLGWTEGVTL